MLFLSPNRRFMLATLGGALAAASLSSVQAAQPAFIPPYALLPNVLYVVPYAVSTNPREAGAPSAETVITIGRMRDCRVQVQWVDWDGTAVGLSGPPGAVLPAGSSLQFHTEAPPVPGPTPLPPYVLNVWSNLQAPFEGKARIRSNCAPNTTLHVDAGFVMVGGPNNPIPHYKRIPVIRPTGNTGG